MKLLLRRRHRRDVHRLRRHRRGRPLTLAKVSSTPPGFSQGFLDVSSRRPPPSSDSTLDEFLAQTELLLHGTTVGTNVLVQMRGARTGLITTRGHRDRADHDALRRPLRRSADRTAAARLAPPEAGADRAAASDQGGLRARRLGRRRRLGAQRGRGPRARSRSWSPRASRRSRSPSSGGSSTPLMSCASRSSSHELAPDVFVTCAHELIAKPGEYERTAAAAINAFIGPATSSYIEAGRPRHRRARLRASAADHAGGGRRRPGRAGGRAARCSRSRRARSAGSPASAYLGATTRATRTSSPATWAAPRSTSAIVTDGEPTGVVGDDHQPVHVLHAAAGHRVDRGRRRLAGVGRRASRGAAGRA